MACGPVRARRAQVFCARHPPGGPSCARPLRRGWRRVRAWPRLRPVAAPPIARGLARTGGAARTTPSAASGLHRVHGPSCGPFGRPVLAARPRLGPRPWPDRRRRRAAPQASKEARGDWSPLGPPNRAPTARGSVHAGPAQLGASDPSRTQGPECGLRRTDGTTAGGLSCGPFGRPVLAVRPVLRPARPGPASASTPLASLRAAARPAAPGV